MKKFIIPLFMILALSSYAEIKVKAKPLEFKEVRAQNNGRFKTKAKARGVILITTDNLKADRDKLVKFEVPDYMMLTNGNNWVKVDEIIFRDKDQEVVIDEETEKVIYHVILDKRELSKNKDSRKIDGEYTGVLPINYSVYGREE